MWDKRWSPIVGVSMIDPQRTWYVDSSVLLRAIVEQSAAAKHWFETAAARGDRFVASLLMEVEVRRVTKNAGVDQDIVSEYVDEFLLMSVNDELLAEAIALSAPLGGADSIHVASAMRLGPAVLTLVTHDRQMAQGALAVGFDVFDPVTTTPTAGRSSTATTSSSPLGDRPPDPLHATPILGPAVTAEHSALDWARQPLGPQPDERLHRGVLASPRRIWRPGLEAGLRITSFTSLVIGWAIFNRMDHRLPEEV